MQKNKKTDPAWFSQPFFFLRFIFYLFLYVCLHWVLIAVHGLSLVAGSRGHSVQGTGFSLQWLLFGVEHRLQGTQAFST